MQDDMLYILSPTSTTPISSHQQPVQTNQVAFCWSGTKVFATTGDGRTRILAYPSLAPVLERAVAPDDRKREFALSGHTSSCLTAEMQPTARFLATGGSDSVIALWDTADWLCTHTLTRMTGPVRSLSTLFFSKKQNSSPWLKSSFADLALRTGFTFDGSYIVGGSDEGTFLPLFS